MEKFDSEATRQRYIIVGAGIIVVLIFVAGTALYSVCGKAIDDIILSVTGNGVGVTTIAMFGLLFASMLTAFGLYAADVAVANALVRHRIMAERGHEKRGDKEIHGSSLV